MTNLIVLMSAVLVAFLVMSTSSTKQTERPLTSTAPKPQFAGCGKNVYDNPHNKVVGGRKVDEEGKFPWMVAILGIEFGIWKLFYGGAIISDRHILTTSHYFEKWMKPSELMVRMGKSNMNST